MSEARFTSPSTPKQRGRKRAAKVKPGASQSEITATPPTEHEPIPAREPPPSAVTIRLSAIDREAMIQTAAYFRAEKRNFESGHDLEDWLAAESEIDAALFEGGLPA